jgi:hypothetical protein
MLAVRSRKAREMMGIKVKDLVVERKIIRAIPDWKERYFNAVYNMSILQHLGRYEAKGNLAPSQCMGIFATLSPRNVVTALEDLTKENMSHLFSLNRPNSKSHPESFTTFKLHYDLEMMELAKQTSKFFGALHAHKIKDYHFVTLDIDQDAKEVLKGMLDIVSTLTVWMVTETSRGYHIILDLTKSEDAKAFYGSKPQDGIYYQLDQKFKGKYDFQRDSQEPVCGSCYYQVKDKIHYVRIVQ